MSITNKRRAFIDEYLKDCNATQAAIRAGYKQATAYSQGGRLLKNVEVSEAIQKRLANKAMEADEVIQRLTEHARGDIGDFIDIEHMSFTLNLWKAKELGLTHLIHKIKDKVVMTSNKDGEETETHYIEFELYDAQAALALLGKYHGLFVERTEITGANGAPIGIEAYEYQHAIAAIATGSGDDSETPGEGQSNLDGEALGQDGYGG